MNIRYEFLTGEVIEVEVANSICKVILELEKAEYNSNRRETRRHSSLEGKQGKGFQIAGSCNVEAEVLKADMNEALRNFVDKLLPQQRELIHKIYFQEMSIAQVARQEGVGESAVRGRLKRIFNNIGKNLR